MSLTLAVNGVVRDLECDPRRLLLDVLREDLGLRGTKYGCGEGECGSCSVLLDGRVVTACLTTAGQAHGADITTIEAMADDEIGRRLLDSFLGTGAVQCGFCTPGFVLAARDLLSHNPAPDVPQIREALSGNLCRCTGYAGITEGVALGAKGLAGPAPRRSTTPGPGISTDGYARPATVDEALQLLAEPRSSWRVLAGGTDLLTRYEHHLDEVGLLDLGGLDELHKVGETADGVQIGALTRFTEIIQSPVMQHWAPALITAARRVGGVQIQNMGTIGGNLANASPAADSVPPLFALDARLVLRSLRGERTVPVSEFALGPGRTVLAPDELLVEIVVPKQQAAGRRIMFFEKVGPRRAQAIAKASVAFCGWLDDGRLHDARIALGAVASTVVSAPKAASLLMSGPFDEALILRAADMAAGECSPIDDIRSTAGYRRRLVRGLVVRNLLPRTARA